MKFIRIIYTMFSMLKNPLYLKQTYLSYEQRLQAKVVICKGFNQSIL
jgi:hypothetical protein